jgi:GNT-I family
MLSKSGSNAPILLFTFKRLDTLMRTVQHLANNKLAKESDLIFFSDEARHEKDRSSVAEVRAFLRTVKGFASVNIVEAPENRGLARSIIYGVSETLKEYDRVIVLEDDLITTPNFLCFMNASLSAYERSERVFSVSGYSFDLGKVTRNETGVDAYFFERGWSWGWATWRDRWTGIDWEMTDYVDFSVDVRARRKFSRGGSDLNLMLRRQMEGKLDSWAVRWFYHQFKVSGLTLYPVLSKVYNDGFDEHATHTRGSNLRFKPVLDGSGRSSFVFPTQIKADKVFQQRFRKKLGVRARILSRVRTVIGKLTQ